MNAQEQWLTAKEAANHMKISTATLYSLVRAKKLRAARLTGSRDLRFRREWIDEWLERNITIPMAVNQ